MGYFKKSTYLEGEDIIEEYFEVRDTCDGWKFYWDFERIVRVEKIGGNAWNSIVTNNVMGPFMFDGKQVDLKAHPNYKYCVKLFKYLTLVLPLDAKNEN